MTKEAQNIASLYTDVHMQLLPLMQKLSKEACQTGMPVVRHLVLNYADDANVYPIEDEFMMGDALLIAPIFDEDTFEREVYLPQGSWTDLLTGEEITGGVTVKVPVTIAQIPIFLNNDSADADAVKKIFEGETWKKIKAL
jgi:alpha-D-xyloside xylohydrolase